MQFLATGLTRQLERGGTPQGLLTGRGCRPNLFTWARVAWDGGLSGPVLLRRELLGQRPLFRAPAVRGAAGALPLRLASSSLSVRSRISAPSTRTATRRSRRIQANPATAPA